VTESRSQPLLLALPTSVLSLDQLLDRRPFGSESLAPFFVLPLRCVQSLLRFQDQLFTLGALHFPRRHFLAALGVSPLLLAFKLRAALRDSLWLI
jgi:hypothetical protein